MRWSVIGGYSHPEGLVAALVHLSFEGPRPITQQQLMSVALDLASHVAVSAPLAVAPGDVNPTVVQAQLEKMSWFTENWSETDRAAKLAGERQKLNEGYALLTQRYVKDDLLTVGEMLLALGCSLDGQFSVERFVRFARDEV